MILPEVELPVAGKAWGEPTLDEFIAGLKASANRWRDYGLREWVDGRLVPWFAKCSQSLDGTPVGGAA